MRETLAHDLGALLCLGEDDRALQNRLNEIADAFGAPWRLRRIKPLGGFNIAGDDCNVFGHAFVAGGANLRMRRVGLLHEHAKQTGVVGQVALQNLHPKIDVAEKALQRVLRLMIRRGSKKPSVISPL